MRGRRPASSRRSPPPMRPTRRRMAAGTQAQNASNTAQQASSHVDQLNTTVNGLDQYHQITDAERQVPCRKLDAHRPIPRQKLDQLAASLTGRDGYILEMEAHSPERAA